MKSYNICQAVINAMKKMKQCKALENSKSRILHRTVREDFSYYIT